MDVGLIIICCIIIIWQSEIRKSLFTGEEELAFISLWQLGQIGELAFR